MTSSSHSFSYVLELSKEHLALSQAEVILFYDLPSSAYIQQDHFLFYDPQAIAPSKRHLEPERFAYTKAWYHVVVSFSSSSFPAILDEIKMLPSLGKGPFFLEVKKNVRGSSFPSSSSLKKILADALWDKFVSPAVSSKGRRFLFTKIGTTFYLLEQLMKKTQHQGIHPKHYPITLPISLKPSLARACINMTGTTTVIVDPFVGLGTTLIESSSLGILGIGFDNHYKMIGACLENLQGLKITHYLLALKDARTIDFSLPYVFCDLPYGRNTKNIPQDLYHSFFRILDNHLLYRAVIIVPHYFPFSLLSELKNLSLEAQFRYYVHKNLTRIILVFENKKRTRERIQ